MRRRVGAVAAAALAAALGGCTPKGPAAVPTIKLPPVVIPASNSSEEKMLAHAPAWRGFFDNYAPNAQLVARLRALLAAKPGHRVHVVYGDWCGDSRDNTPRFAKVWRALGKVDVPVHYWNVDRAKKEPTGFTARYFIRKVPTFVVERDGAELGRIIEHPVSSIEGDLVEILSRK